ncbi:MAG: hypothetical protein HKO83_01070 [Ignavibacteriaceae bacterium]|nr:hypothetical protein [Ignavibacteria bacterium]NNL19903.1 hypothetical protein [Ignavibacteriaceae bacterium]
MKLFKQSFVSVVLLFFLSIKAYGWIYPEHRDITLLAIQNLSPEYRSVLDELWAKARTGYEERLTTAVIDATQSVNPTQLDYASWPAISGDHSCSPENMLYNVLQTDWILQVANIAAQLKIDLYESKNRYEHINAIRDSDIKFQRVDPEYATRAGSNNVHFLLARPNADTNVREYLTACLSEGAELNSLGAYTWFHVSALLKASKFFNENLSDEERSALILSALADEAFALHFLQDSFAAGHTAGTWGDASQRKGTHDYYNEKGLEISTWDGRRMILTGDAFMRVNDAELAAIPIRTSIEQFLDAASGKFAFDYQYGNEILKASPDSFSVCANSFMLPREIDPELIDPIAKILVTTPVPGLATGLGELPRFRTELGLFIGAVSSVRGNTVSGGFGTNQSKPGALGGLDAGIRVGLGIEGVMHGGGDGLVFLDFGWRQDGPSTMRFGNSTVLEEGGQFTAAIPGREGFNFRFRMPFWLLPLDLLITSPILLFSPETYASMAVTAGLGGLIPWQAGIETGIGRIQFILGREIGVTLYGRGKQKDAILVSIDEDETALVNFKSTQLDFPFFEYRPFRTFSLDQSSSLVIQLNFGVDIPHSSNIVLPEGLETPKLRPVWYIGFRAAFDWRYYF